MLRDWSYPHLMDCGWYIDCLKDITFSLNFEIQEKHEPRFFQGVGALEKETATKKRLEAVRQKGKIQILESTLEMQDKEDVPIQSQREVELGLGVASL